MGFWAIFYLTMALIVAGVAWLSPSRAPRVLALFNLASCLLSNAIKINLAPALGLDPLSIIDAAGMGVALILAYDERRRPWCVIIVSAFVCQMGAHVLLATDLITPHDYRLTLNWFFIVQEVSIASGAVRERISRRATPVYRTAHIKSGNSPWPTPPLRHPSHPKPKQQSGPKESWVLWTAPKGNYNRRSSSVTARASRAPRTP